MFGEQIVLDAIKVYSCSPDHHFWKGLNHVTHMKNDKMATALGHDSAYVSLEGITDFDHLKSTYDNFGLSPRESETVFYMIRAKTSKEIGLRLDIRCNTVQKYQEEIKHKMNSQTRSQIIEKAINSGAALVLLKSLLGIGKVSS